MNNYGFNDFFAMGIDIPSLKVKTIEIPVGCEPKVKCKNGFLQSVLIKMFGYKTVYETRKLKTLTIKPENCPKEWDGTLEIQF